ncbi:MAG: stage V sporulation protein AB [Clostridium sp.]
MSLAETLKALPAMSRRIGLAAGLQYLILGIAAGKFAGAWIYFWKGLAV